MTTPLLLTYTPTPPVNYRVSLVSPYGNAKLPTLAEVLMQILSYYLKAEDVQQ